ncbi:MAG: hypothetical protein WKF75_15260 [Singulisphaera sp.]
MSLWLATAGISPRHTVHRGHFFKSGKDMIRPGWRSNMPRRHVHVRQDDCGAASLATIAQHHVFPVGLQLTPDLAGTDHPGLVKAAERLGQVSPGSATFLVHPLREGRQEPGGRPLVVETKA